MQHEEFVTQIILKTNGNLGENRIRAYYQKRCIVSAARFCELLSNGAYC